MDYLAHLALNTGIFIILAVSLNLINGICGQFSLGHAGFWAIGAYTGAAYGVFFAPEALPDFINLFISCGIGFIVAALSGLLIGVPCLRLRGDYLAIATLGFGETPEQRFCLLLGALAPRKPRWWLPDQCQ